MARKHTEMLCPRGLAAIAVLSLAGKCTAYIGGVCIPPNRTISAQATLDGFRADCSEILGNIDIECSNPAQASDVHSLEALRMVGKISGYFRIVGCPGLRNFSHLSNLRAIEGRQLHFEPGVGGGYAVFISNNAGLLTLNGLQNLTSIGKNAPTPYHARVYISQNPQLCWSATVNWKGLLGDRWSRFVYENIGSTCTGAKVCSDACSCNRCVGPTSGDCQGVCEDYSDWETLVIISFVGAMILFATGSVFVYLYVTNRCGVRCVWFGRKIYVGFVPEGGNNAARLSAASLHGAAWTDTLVALKNMEEEEGTTTPDSPSSVPDTSGGASSSSFEAPQGPDGMRERKVGGQESQVMTVN